MAAYSLPHSSASFSPYCCLTGLQPVRGWCLPSLQKWWKHLQPCMPPAKTKARKFLIRKILFEDGAALTAHTEGNLRQLTSSFAHACSEFGIKISLKKTNILCQDVSSTPSKRAPLATTLLRWWRTSFTLAPPFSATSP